MLYDEEVRLPDGGLGREVTPEIRVPYLVGEGVQAGWAGVGQARVGPPLLQQELNLVVLHKTVECAVRNGCVLIILSTVLIRRTHLTLLHCRENTTKQTSKTGWW